MTMPIDPATLLAFLTAVAGLVIVPGPDFVLITTQSATRGTGHGVACALGIAVAGVVQTSLVALGLGHVMEAWPAFAAALRMAGAAYLAHLGIKLLVSWRRGLPGLGATQEAADRTRMSMLVAGIVNNLLNPKALLFFSVFIPQFVVPGLGNSARQIATLGAILTTIACAYNILLALVFARIRASHSSFGAFAQHGNGLLGLLFLGLAGRLALSRATAI
jgi:threonine/homoserine/homoserine lactone efflux protein